MNCWDLPYSTLYAKGGITKRKACRLSSVVIYWRTTIIAAHGSEGFRREHLIFRCVTVSSPLSSFAAVERWVIQSLHDPPPFQHLPIWMLGRGSSSEPSTFNWVSCSSLFAAAAGCQEEMKDYRMPVASDQVIARSNMEPVHLRNFKLIFFF